MTRDILTKRDVYKMFGVSWWWRIRAFPSMRRYRLAKRDAELLRAAFVESIREDQAWLVRQALGDKAEREEDGS